MNESVQANEIARSSSSMMMGFVLGACVGAGIALLMAPATGEETRRRLGDAAKRFGNDMKSRVGDARGALNELKDDAKDALQTGREAFQRSRQSHESRSGYASAPQTTP